MQELDRWNQARVDHHARADAYPWTKNRFAPGEAFFFGFHHKHTVSTGFSKDKRNASGEKKRLHQF
jgi:hypothetical protein